MARVRRFLKLKAERRGRRHGRAEDRRAVDLAAVREWRAEKRRHARRWRGRRGRDRQHPHAEGCAAQAEGQGPSRADRGARRDLHDDEGLRSIPGGRDGSGPQAPGQSAQRGGGKPAPEGCVDHGVAAAALLCLHVGLCVGAVCEDADGGGRALCGVGSAGEPRDEARGQRGGDARRSIATSRRGGRRSATISMASSTRSTGSTGRSGWALCRARRAGRRRTSFPRSRR